jgi:PAS domain S-box-containing protein
MHAGRPAGGDVVRPHAAHGLMFGVAGFPARNDAIERAALALLLGFATFVVATACLANLTESRHVVGFWVANGIPLAVLLRTAKTRWPLLIASAFLGNFAASTVFRPDDLLFNAIACIGNVLQFTFVAAVLRARFGTYFNLLRMRQVLWFCGLSVPATMLKAGVQWTASLLIDHVALVPADPLPWFLSCMLGLLVLSLPLLALSTQSPERRIRFDALGYALIGVLVLLVIAVYGAIAFTGMFVIIPPLMLLAWRYGLFGAGWGALINNVLGSVIAMTTDGITHRLVLTGYSASSAGVFIALFFCVTILISLPVAVARAQQRISDVALTAALAAAERRAAQLGESEAAIRASQEVLRQSEQRFRAIFERAPWGIALIDADTDRFLSMNPTFLDIIGWPEDELIHRTWQDVTDPDRLAAELKLAGPFLANDAAVFQHQKSYIRKDGQAAWVNLAVTRVQMPGSDKPRLLAMIEDITERRVLQQQLDVVQRLDAIGQLTGGIAHDFNNLLTVIIGSSETLAEELEDPDLRELAGLVLDTAERAGELTSSLLAFARRQPLSPRTIDLNRLLSEARPLIQRTLGVNLLFSIEMAADARAVYADRVQTEAAILNLCLNARDAMPEGGRLSLRTENVVFDPDFIRNHSGARVGEYVAVRVSDTGGGIEPDVVPRIFEPFFTTKEVGRGTGLGLAMVYGFTKQSQGYIEVETELGVGTTFSLYLPVGPAQHEPFEALVIGGAPRGDETVLVVEDDDLVRKHAREQLLSLGYRIFEAANGPAAMEILGREGDVTLLFTDIVMPGGMNGRQLAERARELRPELRVLFCSGYSDEMLMEDGRLIEGVALLSKPYSKRDLAESVRQTLDVA